MRYKSRSINVLSAARVSAVIHGSIGLLLAPLFLFSSVIASNAPGAGRAAGVVFVIFALLMPFLYMAMGFVTGALMSWLYNVISKRVGHVEVDLDVVNATTEPISILGVHE
jgi:hypothetical protein